MADTCIVGHTLCLSNALAAAFTAGASQPAFLPFQTGPVQDFIVQALNMLDPAAGEVHGRLACCFLGQTGLTLGDTKSTGLNVESAETE